MTASSLPVWRSLLFVAVTTKCFVDGAARRGADATMLDLEDSVAASEKERARTLVTEVAEIVSRGGADVVVRINRPLRFAMRDIETAIGRRALALPLPKVEGPEHVRLIAEIVDEVEAERGVASGATWYIAMVETTAAFFRIPRSPAPIRGSVRSRPAPRILRCRPGYYRRPRVSSWPKQMAVFAARAAGIMPLGFISTVTEYHDLDGFRQPIRRSRRLGFIGASVVHPSQIPILNEELRANPEEIDHARRVVAAYDTALAEGVGATANGKMIDVPVVERARLLLEREDAIAAREARMCITGAAAS